MSKPLIVVIGATGLQGGGVIQHLLKDGGYTIRGVTRNLNSDRAKALAAQGVEVVKADQADVESLKAAFAGATAAFLLTNYWEIFDVDKEVQYGKNLGDAAKAAGVEHVIWSSLDSTKDVADRIPSIGQWKVPHFDGKALITEYYKEIGLPVTTVDTSFYYDNFLSVLPPRKGEDGKYSLTLPMLPETPLYAQAVSDIGGAVVGFLKQRDRFLNTEIKIAGDNITIKQYVEIMSRVTGVPIAYNYVPPEIFAKFPFPGAEDLTNMFRFFSLPEFTRDVALTKELYPGLLTFEQWAESQSAALKGLVSA